MAKCIWKCWKFIEWNNLEILKGRATIWGRQQNCPCNINDGSAKCKACRHQEQCRRENKGGKAKMNVKLNNYWQTPCEEWGDWWDTLVSRLEGGDQSHCNYPQENITWKLCSPSWRWVGGLGPVSHILLVRYRGRYWYCIESHSHLPDININWRLNWSFTAKILLSAGCCSLSNRCYHKEINLIKE